MSFSTAPMIDFHNATIWRGSTCVFRKLNLQIGQQERVAVLGPNGSGKTTLLKTLNRELYPVVADDSWVKIHGQERWNVWELRRQIGVVSDDLQQRYTPQTSGFDVLLSGFHSSIGVHGALAGRVSKQDRYRAESVLADLDMSAYRDVPLSSMSTGQRRRCLLGRALVHDPDTLLLDEPTAGLDLTAGFEYFRQVTRLAARGKGIVVVTHHLNEIPPAVERVVALKEGEVVADGNITAVLTDELLSELYDTAVRVANIDGHWLAYPG